MKKLSSTEIEGLELKTYTMTSQAESFYKEIATLVVGEGIVISKTEWPLKVAPQGLPKNRRPFPYANYKVRTLADDSGWAIIRTE